MVTHQDDTVLLGPGDAGVEGTEQAGAGRRRPWWLRALMVLGAILLAVVVLGALLYNFGGMSRSAYDPEIRQQYEQLVRSGSVPPVEKRFVIPIPGCTCHSTDPRLTEEHRYYRMNGCTEQGCHG